MTLHAVVPVKAFARAKQRLQGCCTPAERATLARLMLEDVLDVLLEAPGLAGVVVVTADAAAAELARARGAAVLGEPAPGGLNAALAAAARHLVRAGSQGMLIVPGDVPGLTRGELLRLLAAHGEGTAGERRMTIAPAHDRCGTNALVLSPPDALRPAFGHVSFARHRHAAHAAGLRTRTVQLPGLGLDLDHPHDLARFALEPSATRTWRFLDACAPQRSADRTRAHPSNRACPPPSHECHP